MCRLFGFRSVIESQVHTSLVRAENALMVQSRAHPDGWGVSYYVAGTPHVIKSASGALDDHLFRHVSGIVASETVLAHVRKATQGVHSIINSHPFQYGKWVFAHNGNIPDFESHREALVAKIPAVKRRYILGNTDSEVIFYLLLSKMAQRFDLHRPGYPVEDLAECIRETTDQIEAVTGLNWGDENKFFLTFVITNGQTMMAHQGGKELLFSTHKTACPESQSCASFATNCISPVETGLVNHLIISSEELQGQNVWNVMKPGEIVGVDWRMHFRRFAGRELREALGA